MAVVRRSIPCRREEIFEVLVTPETYPKWLVGARAIRSVDEGWPAVGTAFHHRVGLVGPLEVADLSKVLDVDPPNALTLEVRARPFGRARARFVLTEAPEPAGHATVVEFDEVPIGLLERLRPLLDPLAAARNRRSLANLADFLQSGDAPEPPSG